MSLSREVILGMGRPREIVAVPEWGGAVTVTQLAYTDRLEFDRWQAEQPADSDDVLLGLLTFAIVDEQGKRVLALDDIPELRAKGALTIRALIDAAVRLNTRDAAVGAAKGES
jgi:hypothetical protein